VIKLTEGYSCADLFQLFKEAAMYPVREIMKTHGFENFDKWDK